MTLFGIMKHDDPSESLTDMLINISKIDAITLHEGINWDNVNERGNLVLDTPGFLEWLFTGKAPFEREWSSYFYDDFDLQPNSPRVIIRLSGSTKTIRFKSDLAASHYFRQLINEIKNQRVTLYHNEVVDITPGY